MHDRGRVEPGSASTGQPAHDASEHASDNEADEAAGNAGGNAGDNAPDEVVEQEARKHGLKAAATALVVILIALGLPVSPVRIFGRAAQDSNTADAETGTPFTCDYTSALPWFTEPNERASLSSTGGYTTDDGAYHPQMSADGRYATFTSYSEQHVSGDTNDDSDVFRYDRLLNKTELVSRATGVNGAQGNDGATSSVPSANGRHVMFDSGSDTFLGGDPNRAANFSTYGENVRVPDSYLLDLLGDFTIEAWVRTEYPGDYQMIVTKVVGNGGTANNFEFRLNPSSVPEFVQIAGGAYRIVGGSKAVPRNTWVHLAVVKSGTSVTHYYNGVANGSGVVSGTVNYVTTPLRIGARDDLYYGFSGDLDEVAIYKTALPATRVKAHVDAQTTGYAAAVKADAPTSYYRLSDPYNATTSADEGSNRLTASYVGAYPDEPGALLVDNNQVEDVFVRDLVTQTLTRASVGADGRQDSSANGASGSGISGDGRYVAFYTDAAMADTDTNNTYDVWLRDRDTDGNGVLDEAGKSTTTRVSVSATGGQGANASYFARMSPDARYIVMNSYVAWDPADTNGTMDVYVKDRVTGSITLSSPGAAGGAGNDSSYFPTISADGRQVAYYSWASNLISGDTNAAPDIFVRDRATNATQLVSVTSNGSINANGGSYYPTISADGRFVVWQSSASNHVAGDTNAVQDVFLRDRTANTTRRISVSQSSAQANNASETFAEGTLSANGQFAAFSSVASNIVSGDNNGLNDVFVKDMGALSGHGLSLSLGPETVAQSDEIGLEQFQPYRSTDLGTGTAYTHLRTGNLVATFEDQVIPAQGVNAVVRHTYNSKRADVDLGLGKGWSLSVSDLETGLGGVLGELGVGAAVGEGEGGDPAVVDIDVAAPILTSSIGEISGDAFQAVGQILEFTDGDGTTHRFVRKGGPCSRWVSPAGVSLKVREVFSPAVDVPTIPVEYQLIRPDGVVYRVRQVATTVAALPINEWRVTAVEDRRGNALSYEYQTQGAILGRTRLAAIRHNRAGQLARFDYTSDGALDKIVTLPGLTAADPGTGASRSWERHIDYTVDPATRHLTSVTDNSNAAPGGATAATRSTRFAYNGGVLSGVTDGRNNTTQIAYTGGKVSSITDRRGKAWAYSIGSPDPANGDRTRSTVTTPLGAATTYSVSPRVQQSDTNKDPHKRFWGGNILSITDPGHGAASTPITTTYEWTANRLTRTRDGSGVETTREYNDLGLLTRITQPPPNTSARPDGNGAVGMIARPVSSTLEYRFPVDFNYASGCAADDPTGPVSGSGSCSTAAELVRMVAAESEPTQRRLTDFQHDAAGNLTAVIQRGAADTGVAYSAAPAAGDRATTFTYYGRGGLRAIDGPLPAATGRPNDVTTWGDTADAQYGGYDRTGMPTKITDAYGLVKTFGFTPYGVTAFVRDRDGRETRSAYDERDNLVKVTDHLGRADTYLYDGNDNKVRESTSSAVEGTRPGRYATWNYDQNDWVVETGAPGGTATSARTVNAVVFNDDGTTRATVSPRQPTRIYDDAGRKTAEPDPAFTTFFEYWANGLQKKVDAPAAGTVRAVTETEYDGSGRPVKIVAPATTSDGIRPQTRTTYTPNGSVARTEESSAIAQWRTTDLSYNAHGDEVFVEGPRTVGTTRSTTIQVYDRLGQSTQTRRLTESGRWVDTFITYDEAGNQTATSQATGNGSLLTSRFLYDALNRLRAQTVDPVNPGHKVEYAYSGEGQQTRRTDRINGTALAEVVDGEVFRTADTAYNADNTQASMVVTEFDPVTRLPKATLASCNYEAGADPKSGYDVDGLLVVSRTVSGPGGAGCDGAGSVLQRRQQLAYDDRGFLTDTTQEVRSPETGQMVSRTMRYGYDADGERNSARLEGPGAEAYTTTFANNAAGWTERVTDWRSKATTMTYLPSGAPSTQTVGGGVATAEYQWFADQMLKSLTWRKGSSTTTGTVVRSHADLAYDVGGLRTAERVTTLQPDGKTAGGALGTLDYDLLERLTKWSSGFTDPDASARLTTDYTLDDGGNITQERVTKAGTSEQRSNTANTYANGRLGSRKTDTAASGQVVASATIDSFTYNGMGEEVRRESKNDPVGSLGTGVLSTSTTTTSNTFDPMGHTTSVQTVTKDASGTTTKDTKVDYVYDTADRVISRHEPKAAADQPKTTLYFYWGTSGALAEETDAVGASLVRYLADADGEAIAQQKYRVAGGRRDAGDAAGTWRWLLPDASGNTATHLSDDGTVVEQAAYDPYGKPEKSGSSESDPQKKGSTLGFQGAITDKTTGNVVLGARQYDPTTARFTTPDVFVAGELDLALGTDALTGNRYIFAASNPVSFYDDGHWPNPFKAVKKLAKKALPALAFVPIVGTAIDVVSAATGRDILNGGRKLSGGERLMMLGGAALDMATGGVGGKAIKAARFAAQAGSKLKTAGRVAKAVAQSGDEVREVMRTRRAAKAAGGLQELRDYGNAMHGLFKKVLRPLEQDGHKLDRWISRTNRQRPDWRLPNNDVIDLKPNRPSAITSGEKQVKGYLRATKGRHGWLLLYPTPNQRWWQWRMHRVQ